MDKYEYKQKTEQMLELMEDGAFSKAAEIADSIDWKRVRNSKMLTDVSDIYEKNGDYQKSYDVLNIAYHRAEGSRKIIYRLCTLALKTKNVDEAIDYYDDFQQIAPKDPNKFLLQYQILRAQRAPIDQQIDALEAFKKAEYIEEWAYELAKLYQEAGLTAKCLDECDDLILWFNEGKYVYQAMELKMKYKPLTPSQQEKYDRRYEGLSNETVEMPNVAEYQKEKEASAAGESTEDVSAEIEGDTNAASERIIPESKMVDAKGRKIGNTMKLDEALKSLLHLGMDDEDKVEDSSNEPVSTDVTFDEDKLKDAIEEIEAVVDLNLVDELSNQKGLRELKVDPDLEELLPDPLLEDAEEDNSPGNTRLDAATTIMEPIHLELQEKNQPEEKNGTQAEEMKEPEVQPEKTLEELYAEAGEPIGVHNVGDELAEVPYAETREVYEEQQSQDAELHEEQYTETEQLMRELDEEARETIAELDEEERGTLDQLDEEAREVIEGLDEEVRKTIEELDAEEGNTAERQNTKTSKSSMEERRDQIEGQMSLLDMMSGMDIQEDIILTGGDEETSEEAEETQDPQTENSGIDVEDKNQAARPILPPDIQQMIDEIEGVVQEDGLAEVKAAEIKQEEPKQEELRENMEEAAEMLHVHESSELFEDYDDITNDAGYEEELPIQIENALDVEEYENDMEISFDGEYEAEDMQEYEDVIEFSDIRKDTEAGEGVEIEYQEEDEDASYIEKLSKEVSEYEMEYDDIERDYAEDYEDGRFESKGFEYAGEYRSEEPVYVEEQEDDELVFAEAYEDTEPVYEEMYEGEESDYEDVYEDEEADYEEVYEGEESDYEDIYEGEEPEYEEVYEGEESDYEEAYEGEESEYEGEEPDYMEDGLDDTDGYGAEEYGEYSEGYGYEEDEYYEEEDAEEYAYDDEYEYDAATIEANLEDEFSPAEDYEEEYDEREMPEEEEEIDILSKTTPLSRKETAKLIATGKTSPLPMDEISDALSLSDTGFVVHGRYDLKMQSGIGTRAGLTEEQKKLFSYFVPVRGMSEQLVDVLEQDKNCTNRRGTSTTGNLLIIGNKGNGKTVLAVDVVKAIQKQRNIRQGKVAIVTGDSLNKKKISDIFSKLYGGALIIEKAGKMNEKTVARVNKAMERDTGELLIVLEDQRKPLDRLLTSNREFRRKFTSRLEVPILINDELVTFGQTYAQENGYQIDEMGILALYSRIDMLQREDHAVTIAEVKEVMDEAMEHSQKASAKKLVKRVLGKNRDDSDRIILTEKDFN